MAVADREQVFESVGSGASWNRSMLNHLKAALQPGYWMKESVAGPLEPFADRGFGLLGWQRESGVEIVNFLESVDHDSAMGQVIHDNEECR